MKKYIELFHIGPQKSGTTWLYYNISEHPEIAAPPSDSIHYFDIHYFRGREWLMGHFKNASAQQKLFDPTYTYIRSPLVPKRIRKENPNARIAVCMRHPLKRAFSHYWHEKKKSRYNFSFTEVLKNYDLFANWIEPGFYASHIEQYLEYFSREQILPQLYDDMVYNPSEFLRELFAFYGVNPEFSPSKLNKYINVATPKETRIRRKTKIAIKKAVRQGMEIVRAIHLRDSLAHVNRLLSNPSLDCGKSSVRRNNMEYLCDEPQTFLEDLMSLCVPEIERLERLLCIDLSIWKSLESIGC